MEKRVRSPNYPALSLPDALNKVEALYKSIHTHSAPREVVAKGMGYNTLNGASATAISALHKYGLLDKLGDEVKVSNRAMRILLPESPEEKAAAIREAASDPTLFQELAARFPGMMPNEELLRNYLLRNSFAPAAVSQVILAYRDTVSLVESVGGSYDSVDIPFTETAAPMSPSPQPQAPQAQTIQPPPPVYVPVGANERSLGRYDFEDGGYVRLAISGEMDTEAALDMIETLVELKRKELARRKTNVIAAPTNSAPGSTTDEKETDE